MLNHLSPTCWKTPGAGFKPRRRSVDDVRRHPERLAAFSPAADAARARSKEFLFQNLYHSESLRPQKADGQKIINDLFGYWIEHPTSLSATYQQQMETEAPARVICDYIAGMTDNYILNLHRKLIERSVPK